MASRAPAGGAMNNTRYDYSAIVTRPPLRWPNDARVAVWVIPNIEHFHIDRPGTALRPESAQQAPDVYNFAWRDYGLRVGIWRLMAILDKYGVRATVALNAEVCDHYPLIVQEGVKRGWEFMGHGLTNSQRLAGLSEAEEREVIARTLARIEHVGDWCADDQPFPMRVARGELIAMPYTVELNDIPLFLHHHFTGQQFYEAIRDQFDVLYQEGRESGRVMAIALHPFITGVPHRAKYLDQALAYVTGHRHVWLATGSEILDAYRAQLAHAA